MAGFSKAGVTNMSLIGYSFYSIRFIHKIVYPILLFEGNLYSQFAGKSDWRVVINPSYGICDAPCLAKLGVRAVEHTTKCFTSSNCLFLVNLQSFMYIPESQKVKC